MMKLSTKGKIAAIGIAGALSLMAATPSMAYWHNGRWYPDRPWNPVAAAGEAAGSIVGGTLAGAAAVASGGYYGGYYGPGYEAYGYAPGPAYGAYDYAPGPASRAYDYGYRADEQVGTTNGGIPILRGELGPGCNFGQKLSEDC